MGKPRATITKRCGVAAETDQLYPQLLSNLYIWSAAGKVQVANGEASVKGQIAGEFPLTKPAGIRLHPTGLPSRARSRWGVG